MESFPSPKSRNGPFRRYQQTRSQQTRSRNTMHTKHTAAELKAMALCGAVSACEMRAFSARHAGTLDATSHVDFVEAFVLQLGHFGQHAAILQLLSACVREFRAGKIAYKPPGGAQLTSVLDVARWVDRHVAGLAHAERLGRAQRVDAGSQRVTALPSALGAADDMGSRAMEALRRRRVHVPRDATLALVVSHTSLVDDYVTHKTLTGEVEQADRMARGEAGLLQLFDRGAQDRKELEALVCVALRERGRLLAFTSAELLLDRELVLLLGEEDRVEGARRADAYVIVEEGVIVRRVLDRCDKPSVLLQAGRPPGARRRRHRQERPRLPPSLGRAAPRPLPARALCTAARRLACERARRPRGAHEHPRPCAGELRYDPLRRPSAADGRWTAHTGEHGRRAVRCFSGGEGGYRKQSVHERRISTSAHTGAACQPSRRRCAPMRGTSSFPSRWECLCAH